MSSELLTITGTVFIHEPVTLPPGAIVTVKLVDNEGEVLAATAIGSAAVPTEFTLVADPAFAPDADELFIWAALRSRGRRVGHDRAGPPRRCRERGAADQDRGLTGCLEAAEAPPSRI